MRKQVSEKTLELNIAAEILQTIRGLPGCNRAFWFGLKQDQEARWGPDEILKNVPRGYHLVLQFKSPRSQPQDTTPYNFTVNDRQNNNLLRLANARPDAVYYVFPHYNTLSRIGTDSPTLLNDTWFLRIAELNRLPLSSNRKGTHLVESMPRTVTIHHSDVYEAKTSSLSAIKEQFSNGYNSLVNNLLDHGVLKEWIGETYVHLKGNRRSIGQLFRGFATICLPGD